MLQGASRPSQECPHFSIKGGFVKTYVIDVNRLTSLKTVPTRQAGQTGSLSS
jgi:hypothetical protein